MRRRQYSLVFSLPSPFYSRARRCSSRRALPQVRPGVRQSAPSSATAQALGTGAPVCCTFVLSAVVRPGCLRTKQVGFRNHRQDFASIRGCCVYVFACGVCPMFPRSDRIPETGAGSPDLCLRARCACQGTGAESRRESRLQISMRGVGQGACPCRLRRNRFPCYFSNYASACS